MIVLTSLVHLVATKISLVIIQKSTTYSPKSQKVWNLIWLDTIVILMIVAAVAEAMIWAASFNMVGAIKEFGEAVYFSIVTYTTLGYGDITLEPNWRILASLEAATGIIIFGWSTAIVMAAIQNIYFGKSSG